MWPKSSDSSSSLEMAAQLIETNCLSRRGLASWMALANISLPVPLSPRISTETSRRAAREARPTATRMLRLSPTIASKPCDVLRALAGEALQPGVGVPQDLRDEVHHEVERDLGHPGFALVGLVEGRRVVLALAEQQPDRRHGGVPGLRCMQRSSRCGARDVDDRGQFGVDDLEDLGVVGRIGELHGMEDGIAAEPLHVRAVLSRPWSLRRWTSSNCSESSRHFSGPG